MAAGAERLAALWERLNADERRHRLPETRPPEPGFSELAHRWASGVTLADLFDDEVEGIGDFVRNCRQLIDVLLQIRDAAPRLAETASAAAAAIDRGVVAAEGAV